MGRRTAFALLLVLLVAFPALAHPAQPPTGRFVRLLHDYNDDHGGEAAVNDGHDLIALDAETNRSAARGPYIVFRLTMNGGWSATTQATPTRPALDDYVRFKVDGVAKDILFHTTNNETWSGDGCDAHGPRTHARTAAGARDGTRYTVDCIVSYARIGAKAGSNLTGFRVDGYFGTSRGDYMPGGSYVSGNEVTTRPPADQAQPALFERGWFALPKAVNVTGPASHAVPAGGWADVSFTVKELLGTAQTGRLDVTVPTGWTAPASTFTLAENASVTVTVNVSAIEGASAGNLTATATTDHAGESIAKVRLVLGPAAPKPPGAPRDLVATPGPGRVSLSWAPPEGTPPTAYRVDIGRTTPPEFVPLGQSAATTRVVDDLDPGVVHHFRVVALNAVGAGPPSAVVSATPLPRASGDAPPRILLVEPVGEVAFRRPTLRAEYEDDRGVESADLVVDGVAVTGLEFTNTSLAWTPAEDLSAGSHLALVRVRDAAGGSAERSWQFVVPPQRETEPPSVVELAPSDGATVADPFTNIVARFGDASGVDTSGVVLAVDGAPVAARVDASSASWAPTVALSEGRHTVVLTLADVLGNVGNTTWRFTVKSPTAVPSEDDAPDAPGPESETPGAGVALLLLAAVAAARVRRR